MRMCLALAFVATACGCGSELKVDAKLIEAVQVSKSEPGPWCHALGAVEGVSDMVSDGYPSAYLAVRTVAAQKGANYVVIDHVAGARLSTEYWRDLTIAGRAFACPTVDGFTRARVYVADPPEQVSDGHDTSVRPPAVSTSE